MVRARSRCGRWAKPRAGAGGGAARARALRRVMRGGEAGGRDRDGAGSGRIIGERREQSGRRGRLKCLRRRWGRGQARRGGGGAAAAAAATAAVARGEERRRRGPPARPSAGGLRNPPGIAAPREKQDRDPAGAVFGGCCPAL
ncbi:protein argonaute 12-like [Aquila chrysaetos chrysaetos]|uniref:protein argonaute 12-like n=1 Tax=Aquila chrysaetos chrysaetos TaxID=223781 RepID=UPI001177252C|nr:protein argonaute 12-like [Aquila chrysaetos chrysaetos]